MPVRQINTNEKGGQWTQQQINAVWNKGTIIHNYSMDEWRWDKCGLPIKYSEHGNRDSEYGWEIDHINPVAKGGGDFLLNLQPLQWNNNLNKGDSLNWKCPPIK